MADLDVRNVLIVWTGYIFMHIAIVVYTIAAVEKVFRTIGSLLLFKTGEMDRSHQCGSPRCLRNLSAYLLLCSGQRHKLKWSRTQSSNAWLHWSPPVQYSLFHKQLDMTEIAYFLAFALNTLNSYSLKGQTANCLSSIPSINRSINSLNILQKSLPFNSFTSDKIYNNTHSHMI